MSDSEDPLMSLDNLVGKYEAGDLSGELQEEEAAAPVKAPEATVRWKKRDVDGNVLYARPRSSRNPSIQGQYCFAIQDIFKI